MPSPFPGMDPYLEDPAVWPGFHNKLVSEMETALTQNLLPNYYARSEERVYITTDLDPGRKVIIPDVHIVPSDMRSRPKRPTVSASTSVLECEPIEITMLIDQEIHEPFVKILSRHSKEVVAIIEILSPTNKVVGSVGREQYLAKREDALRSRTHWVEIDLLRLGVPTIARDLYPPCEYTIHISRANRRRRATVWPIRLAHRLPRIPIPLKGDDPDAHLELQPIFDAVYDRSVYSVDIDYTEDPNPPLSAELAKWANKLLKQKKLR